MLKSLVAMAVLALAFTTGFTCSKEAPQEAAPAAQEAAPPPAEEMAAPAEGAAPMEAAPAEGVPAEGTPAPAEGSGN